MGRTHKPRHRQQHLANRRTPALAPAPREGADLKQLKELYKTKHSKKRAAELFSRYQALVQRDGPSCDLCGVGQPIEFDHIIPKPSGGSNELTNFCLAHEYCNKMKGSSEHSAAREKLTAQRIAAEQQGKEWPPVRWSRH